MASTASTSSAAWRPQPHVAEGRLRSIVARFAYDTRNEGVDPTTGWWIRAEVERGACLRAGHAVGGQPVALLPRGQRPLRLGAEVPVHRDAERLLKLGDAAGLTGAAAWHRAFTPQAASRAR